MFETNEFRRWLMALRDREARSRILVRLRRLTLGNFGDTRSLGGGLTELRVDHDPGYRMYLIRTEETVIVVLAGGDKRTQRADVERARRMAHALREA